MKPLQPEWLAWPQIQQLARAFSAQADALRFVGGCVRDSLLGRAVSDIDIATSLLPRQVMQLAQAAGIKAIPTGLAHGTVTVVIDALHIQVTTLRNDIDCDGRHADVEFTDDWQEDAKRRDFTMNALYMGFDGTLVDYTGGIEDALAGRVRFIGDAGQRIQEDYLRILRFFRFFAWYGREQADSAALTACGQHKNNMATLSGERIQAEMQKLLAAPDSLPSLRLMQQTGVLQLLIGEHALARLEQLLQLQHYAPDKIHPATRLAALLAPAEIDAVIGRWKLPNALRMEIKQLHERLHSLKPDLPLAEQKRLLRRYGREAFMQLALLAWAQHGQKETRYREFLALAENWPIPEFPLTGGELKASGMKSGKELGKTLAMLEEKWEASDYKLSKEELLQQLKQGYISSTGISPSGSSSSA